MPIIIPDLPNLEALPQTPGFQLQGPEGQAIKDRLDKIYLPFFKSINNKNFQTQEDLLLDDNPSPISIETICVHFVDKGEADCPYYEDVE